MRKLTVPGADEKNATLTLQLKANSGYRSVEAHEISANQWSDILSICMDGDRAKVIRASDDMLEALQGVAQTLKAQIAAGIRWDPREVDAVFAAITKATGGTA